MRAEQFTGYIFRLLQSGGRLQQTLFDGNLLHRILKITYQLIAPFHLTSSIYAV